MLVPPNTDMSLKRLAQAPRNSVVAVHALCCIATTMFCYKSMPHLSIPVAVNKPAGTATKPVAALQGKRSNVLDKNFMQVAFFCCFRHGVAGMSRDLGRDVPDLEKLYAKKLWGVAFSYPIPQVKREITASTSSKGVTLHPEAPSGI